MLSIFNNGSQLWVLFLILLGWVGFWGWRTYKSHKEGYHRQLPGGGYEDQESSLFSNGNFWFGVFGAIGLIVAILVINADYR